MNRQQTRVALQTLVTKEIRRFMRIWLQTLLPPAITMSLYFVIFGNLVGRRIGLQGLATVPGHRVSRLLDQCDEQLLLGADVVVERGTIDADLNGDVFEACSGESFTEEDLGSSLEDGLPPLAGSSAVGVAPFVAPTCVVALRAGCWNLSFSSCVARVINPR